MNPKTIADAVLGFVITFGTAAIALLAGDGVAGVGDVSQASWLAALLGALVAAAKTVQSRLADPEPSTTNPNRQSGRALPALLLAMGLFALVWVSLQGCATHPNNALAAASLSIEQMAKEVATAQRLGEITPEREDALLDRLQVANDELRRAERLINQCAPEQCQAPAGTLERISAVLSEVRAEIAQEKTQ